MAVTATTQLAIEQGPKAFAAMSGKRQPKIGIDEFMSLAERFGFSPEALVRLRAAVSEADLGDRGPNLARYACPFPPNTKGEQFEATARALFGSDFARGVSSGTAALHCAFAAAGVGPGTEVIVPAIGFFATSAAVVLCGGVPVFCDVDESLQIDPGKIERLVTPRTVAVAPTHYCGGVCDMEPILAVARRRGIKVVEDCAQSPGARYRGRHVGTIGDLGCFSISCYKIIGGGEGGLVLCNDRRLFERVSQFAEGGGLWRPDRFAPPRYDGELFVGANYRMSELEAAVDVVQLLKLPQIVARYQAVKSAVMRQLKSFAQITPQKLNDADGEVGYQLRFYPQTKELGEKIVAALRAEGVACLIREGAAGPDWHVYSDMFPVTLKATHTPHSPFTDPRYVSQGGRAMYRRGDCPVADELFARVIVVLLDQWYSPDDCENVARGINKVLSAYCTEASGPSWV